jgi:hypothetical protein
MPKHSTSAGAANRPQLARAIRDAVWEWLLFVRKADPGAPMLGLDLCCEERVVPSALHERFCPAGPTPSRGRASDSGCDGLPTCARCCRRHKCTRPCGQAACEWQADFRPWPILSGAIASPTGQLREIGIEAEQIAKGDFGGSVADHYISPPLSCVGHRLASVRESLHRLLLCGPHVLAVLD